MLTWKLSTKKSHLHNYAHEDLWGRTQPLFLCMEVQVLGIVTAKSLEWGGPLTGKALRCLFKVPHVHLKLTEGKERKHVKILAQGLGRGLRW